jgi:hypothetical protein
MVTKPPFKTTAVVRDACLCLHMQRAARARARRFGDALRPIGFTNGQFLLMMSLNRPQPPDMGVASLLGIDRTTLAAARKPLQRRGLLTLRVDAADRRSRLMTLKRRRLFVRAVPCGRGPTLRLRLFCRMATPIVKNLSAVSCSANPFVNGSRPDRTTKQWSVVASVFKASG